MTVVLRTRFQRCTSNPWITGATAFVLTVVILLTHFAAKYGLNIPPSTTGDEVSYDRIGWNLATGAGFSEGGDDPEFFRLYDQAGAYSPEHVARRRLSSAEPVAYRPPMFPLALAGLNLTCGRQFWAVRTLNVLATAGTCAVLVWYLTKYHGRTAALTAFCMFLIVDTRTRLFGRAILTEATATFFTTIATVLLIHLSEVVRLRTVALLGFIVGVMVLDRTIFALWLPGMALIIYGLSHVPYSDGTSSHRYAGISAAAVFLVVTGLVVFPWAVRNISVLDTWMPLGTQGMTQLPAGFSDHAVERDGVWDLKPAAKLLSMIDVEGTTRLERDVQRARLGKTTALSWIRKNPLASLRLAGMKIWQEYRPRAFTEWFISLCALSGLLLSVSRTETRVFLAVHAVNCFSIGCTWSVEGRFVVPLMFSIHVLAAVALSYPLRAVRNALT